MPVAPVPLAMAPSQIPIKANIGIAGTPNYHHPAAVAPAPAQSPAHFQMQHFVPRQAPAPSPHQGQLHLQPQPQQMPMHVPHPGMPQMQPSPHYAPHAYPQQYGAQPQAPPLLHYQTPTHLAPTFDQHHRPVHPAPPNMTPSRPPMAPTPSIATLPHANAHAGHVYNVPRAPEVYTLAENVDAAIPKEVREQFQRDENGRVLFFTAPPLERPSNRVAEQYAGLGHSVKHLASIKELREERARKRKERDEALAREHEANKKQALSTEADAQQRQAEAQQKTQAETLEALLRGWAADMDRGTKQIYEDLGPGWKEMMAQSRAENKGKTDEEIRVKNLQWLYDDSFKRGEITAEGKKQLEDCFIHRKHLDDN